MPDAASTSWLLNDLVARVPAARAAVVLSVDGLLTEKSKELPVADAERLAAVAAGFAGLARTAGRHFRGGAVRRTIVEMESAFLFVTAAETGMCLAVLTAEGSDTGLIAAEMAVLMARIGHTLGETPRNPGHVVDMRRSTGRGRPSDTGDRRRRDGGRPPRP